MRQHALTRYHHHYSGMSTLVAILGLIGAIVVEAAQSWEHLLNYKIGVGDVDINCSAGLWAVCCEDDVFGDDSKCTAIENPRTWRVIMRWLIMSTIAISIAAIIVSTRSRRYAVFSVSHRSIATKVQRLHSLSMFFVLVSIFTFIFGKNTDNSSVGPCFGVAIATCVVFAIGGPAYYFQYQQQCRWYDSLLNMEGASAVAGNYGGVANGGVAVVHVVPQHAVAQPQQHVQPQQHQRSEGQQQSSYQQSQQQARAEGTVAMPPAYASLPDDGGGMLK